MKKWNKGFSLISAVVSSVILVVGILTLIRIFLSSPVIDAKANKLSIASSLGEEKLEEFRSIGYDSILDLINAGITSGTDVINGIRRTWMLPTSIPTDGQINVRVECSWKNPQTVDSSSVDFFTIISYHE